MFCKIGVLENFAKFTEKHLCQSSFYIKVAGDALNFIKKETVTQVLFCEFWGTFKNTFLQSNSGVLRQSCIICTYGHDKLMLFFNSFMTEVPIIQKSKFVVNFIDLRI